MMKMEVVFYNPKYPVPNLRHPKCRQYNHRFCDAFDPAYYKRCKRGKGNCKSKHHKR